VESADALALDGRARKRVYPTGIPYGAGPELSLIVAQPACALGTALRIWWGARTRLDRIPKPPADETKALRALMEEIEVKATEGRFRAAAGADFDPRTLGPLPPRLPKALRVAAVNGDAVPL
jgi:hypothetical protein